MKLRTKTTTLNEIVDALVQSLTNYSWNHSINQEANTIANTLIDKPELRLILECVVLKEVARRLSPSNLRSIGWNNEPASDLIPVINALAQEAINISPDLSRLRHRAAILAHNTYLPQFGLIQDLLYKSTWQALLNNIYSLKNIDHRDMDLLRRLNDDDIMGQLPGLMEMKLPLHLDALLSPFKAAYKVIVINEMYEYIENHKYKDALILTSQNPATKKLLASLRDPRHLAEQFFHNSKSKNLITVDDINDLGILAAIAAIAMEKSQAPLLKALIKKIDDPWYLHSTLKVAVADSNKLATFKRIAEEVGKAEFFNAAIDAALDRQRNANIITSPSYKRDTLPSIIQQAWGNLEESSKPKTFITPKEAEALLCGKNQMNWSFICHLENYSTPAFAPWENLKDDLRRKWLSDKFKIDLSGYTLFTETSLKSLCKTRLYIGENNIDSTINSAIVLSLSAPIIATMFLGKRFVTWLTNTPNKLETNLSR